MSKKQIEKNIQLSGELVEYLTQNPQVIRKMPAESSFVVFSAGDKKLNKLNQRLAKNLSKQGRKVVKAKETKSSKAPWAFTPCFT